MKRVLSWRYWICSLAFGLLACAFGVKVFDRWFWFGALAALLGSIDARIDP